MVILNSKDYFEVKLMSLIADYDRDTLTNLYQPIIGYTALAVYFTLWSEGQNQKVASLTTHGQIMRRMRITPGDFIEARKILEAVGLLKTYIEMQEDENKFFTYEIYAPKTPKSFFDDALLYGLLIKMLGESEANKFKTLYKFEKNDNQGKEVSASFLEVFSPNFEDPAFIKALEGGPSIGRNSAKIISSFSYESFFNEIKRISNIKEEAFSKKDMKEIERLATLNGINEVLAAEKVVSIYDAYAGKGKHIDYVKLAKMFQEYDGTTYSHKNNDNESGPNLNSGTTELARKINLMETISPKQYLSLLQNGTQPALADLRLVNDLSQKFNLPNCVINALLDYALLMNDNVLSRAYCEKVAASLAREGVQTTIDAMNYLRKAGKKTNKGPRKTKYEKGVEEVKEKEVTQEDNEEQVSWEELLGDGDDGDPNGKA